MAMILRIRSKTILMTEYMIILVLEIEKFKYTYIKSNSVELKDSIYRYSTNGEEKSFNCKLFI